MPENEITATEHFLNICLFGGKYIIKMIVAYWQKKKMLLLKDQEKGGAHGFKVGPVVNKHYC